MDLFHSFYSFAMTKTLLFIKNNYQMPKQNTTLIQQMSHHEINSFNGA